jgi:FixJ family two-component response regulator
MPKRPTEKSGLEQAIDKALNEMKTFSAEEDEYAKIVEQLDKLYALKELEKPERVSKDTLATIAANLIGIVLIVGYERTNIVTSKALNFLKVP